MDSDQVIDDESENQKEGSIKQSGKRRGDNQQGASRDCVGAGSKEQQRDIGDEERDEEE